jgi:sorbitol-specific phosphotransferase system component IIBC
MICGMPALSPSFARGGIVLAMASGVLVASIVS